MSFALQAISKPALTTLNEFAYDYGDRYDKGKAQTYLWVLRFDSLGSINDFPTPYVAKFAVDGVLRNVGLSPLYGMGMTVTRERPIFFREYYSRGNANPPMSLAPFRLLTRCQTKRQ